MKTITERAGVIRSTALGRSSSVAVQYFQVEESDIGRELHNYLGRHRGSYTVKKEDVGRYIEAQYDGGVVTMTNRQKQSFSIWSVFAFTSPDFLEWNERHNHAGSSPVRLCEGVTL